MTSSTQTRTAKRTPSTIKWLLTERAALVGEQEKLAKQIGRLQQRAQELASKVAALDVTLELVAPEVSPTAGGALKVWSGRWGEYGALTSFIHSRIKEAGAVGLETRHLSLMACAHFDIEVTSSKELRSLQRNAVYPVLKQGREDGLLVSQVLQGGRYANAIWRWADCLKTLKSGACDAGACESPTDPTLVGK